jgi:hypothetical protein
LMTTSPRMDSPGFDMTAASTDNVGPMINIVGWILVAVSGMFLFLRIYCKWLGHKRLWWDDFFLILSWVRFYLTRSPWEYTTQAVFLKLTHNNTSTAMSNRPRGAYIKTNQSRTRPSYIYALAR